jgi:putative FmdB family regulatory protein
VPVYEYVCTVCGHPVEVMHSYTAEGPKSCERCGSPMRKALSTPAIVFKGSGWAKKDHRDKVHASSKADVTPAVTTEAATTTGATADGAQAATTPSSDTAGGTSTTPASAPAAVPASAPTSSKSSAASSG